MATAYETITQAVRAWARTVLGWTEAQAADLIVPVDRGPEKGRRPAVPFVTVDFALSGQQVGTDEKRNLADGTRVRRGTRRGRVNIQGFGLATSDWLEDLAMNADLATAPLTIHSYGEIVDISNIAGTHIEARYSRDFDVDYAVIQTSDPGTVAPLRRVITTIDVEDGGDDLEQDLNVVLVDEFDSAFAPREFARFPELP